MREFFFFFFLLVQHKQHFCVHVMMLLSVVAACAAAVAAQEPCAGSYSLCKDGPCALTKDVCGTCKKGEYVCPLSATCVASAVDVGGCKGSIGTHYDPSLSIEARLDWIFSQKLTIEELTSQMTDNATAVSRLAIPA
jgi:hypothetical protein